MRDEQPSIDGLSTFLGMRWEAVDRCRLTIRPDLINPGGMLTGPVTFAMLDYTMGSALYAHCTSDEAIATISLSVNYIATAREGDVIAHITLDRRTRTNATLRGEVVAEDGRLLTTAIGSFSIFRRKDEAPGGPFAP